MTDCLHTKFSLNLQRVLEFTASYELACLRVSTLGIYECNRQPTETRRKQILSTEMSWLRKIMGVSRLQKAKNKTVRNSKRKQ